MSSSPPSVIPQPLADESTDTDIGDTTIGDDETVAGSDSLENRASGRPAHYHNVWRWHFYAGLLVAPILLAATLTGAIYVFKAELSNWFYAGLYFVEPGGDRLSYEEQRRIVQQSAGDLELEGLFVSTDPRRSTQFVAHVHEGGDANPEQMHRVFYINPYTGEMLGTQVLEREFFGVVLKLHRTLFAGVPGRIAVELATCWGLVLMATGVYLWWPRGRQGGRGVWFPRMRGKLYAVLRDWHSVSGFYTAILAILVLGTGLFFSQVWGTGYFLFINQAGQVPPTVFGPYPVPDAPDQAPRASLDLVVERMVEQSRPDDMILIQESQDAGNAHKAFLMSGDNHSTMRIVAVDPYSGRTLEVMDVAEMPPLLRLYGLAVDVHTGVVFGMPSKIAAFVTCLVLMALIVTGVWMWWRRRPKGSLGTPRRATARLPLWAKILVVLTCLAMPVLGLSLLLIFAFRFAIRLIPRRSAAVT